MISYGRERAHEKEREGERFEWSLGDKMPIARNINDDEQTPANQPRTGHNADVKKNARKRFMNDFEALAK